MLSTVVTNVSVVELAAPTNALKLASLPTVAIPDTFKPVVIPVRERFLK